jgi:hypothetical protein
MPPVTPPETPPSPRPPGCEFELARPLGCPCSKDQPAACSHGLCCDTGAGQHEGLCSDCSTLPPSPSPPLPSPPPPNSPGCPALDPDDEFAVSGAADGCQCQRNGNCNFPTSCCNNDIDHSMVPQGGVCGPCRPPPPPPEPGCSGVFVGEGCPCETQGPYPGPGDGPPTYLPRCDQMTDAGALCCLGNHWDRRCSACPAPPNPPPPPPAIPYPPIPPPVGEEAMPEPTAIDALPTYYDQATYYQVYEG